MISEAELQKAISRLQRAISDEERRRVVKELEKIKRDYGKVTPSLVVAVAKDPRSPLHKYFEWDDSAAASKYRLMQARVLLVVVQVHPAPPPERKQVKVVRPPAGATRAIVKTATSDNSILQWLIRYHQEQAELCERDAERAELEKARRDFIEEARRHRQAVQFLKRKLVELVR